MKKYVCLLLCCLIGFLLTACHGSGTDFPVVDTTSPTVYTEAATEPVLELVLPPETTYVQEMEFTQPQVTEPQHSEFFIHRLSVEDVIAYFSEVCLDAEIAYSGNPSLLQKWTEPIRYTVSGNYTEEDLKVFSTFLKWLNSVEGFPGIYEALPPEEPNLRIFFCEEQELVSRMGEEFYGLDGAVTFWYDRNEIYDGTICYRTDIDQVTRNSVILEEIYNALGPIQDTVLRPDSIIYAEFSEPQELTEIDRLILKLLYHPLMECGMDAQSCEAVIRQLYY